MTANDSQLARFALVRPRIHLYLLPSQSGVQMNCRFLPVSILSLILSFFLTVSAIAAISVDVANAPESDLALTLKAISGAKRSLAVNIYEFTSPSIADALVAKIKSGVHVDILAENQPVGGMSKEGKAIQQQVLTAMSETAGDHYFVMTSKTTLAKRRFRFDHAKYIVADGETLLIGSENYSPTGNPLPGSKGNRGWEVLIHDRNIAQEYAQMFTADTSLSFGDVLDLSSDSKIGVRHMEPNLVNLGSGDVGLAASAVEKITSPETSESGILALLNSARTSIDIQQMTFSSEWANGNSPLLDAVITAAKRGVRVRVLLNDESVFNRGQEPVKSKNLPTVEALNELGKSGLKVSAKIANLKGMGVDYIHNKGLLVDGNKTLISSINWDENSVQNNRKSAVVITSPAVFQYFNALFNRDWNLPAQPAEASAQSL
jgi:cardiolipin synthase